MAWSTTTVCKKVRIGANEVGIIGKFCYATIQAYAGVYTVANIAQILICYS